MPDASDAGLAPASPGRSAWVENGAGRLVSVRFGPATGVLRVLDGPGERRFHLAPAGPAVYRLARLDRAGDPDEPAGYHVRLGWRAGEYDECECKAYHRHGRCVHTAAVRTVVANDWLRPAETSDVAGRAGMPHNDLPDRPAANPQA